MITLLLPLSLFFYSQTSSSVDDDLNRVRAYIEQMDDVDCRLALAEFKQLGEPTPSEIANFAVSGSNQQKVLALRLLARIYPIIGHNGRNAIVRALDDASDEVKIAALAATHAKHAPLPGSLDKIVGLLRSQSDEVVAQAVMAAAAHEVNPHPAKFELLRLVKSGERSIRLTALSSLVKMSVADAELRPTVLNLFSNKDNASLFRADALSHINRNEELARSALPNAILTLQTLQAMRPGSHEYDDRLAAFCILNVAKHGPPRLDALDCLHQALKRPSNQAWFPEILTGISMYGARARKTAPEVLALISPSVRGNAEAITCLRTVLPPKEAVAALRSKQKECAGLIGPNVNNFVNLIEEAIAIASSQQMGE